VAHSVEVLFDAETEARIRRQWELLAAAGLPSQSRISASSNRPHVTLGVAERIASAVDDPLRALTHHFPLRCVVGAPLLFGGRRFTLARLVVPSEDLLALHREVVALSGPQMSPGPAPHCEPGQWTPHVTLGRRFSAEQAGQALAEVRGLGADLVGHFVGLRRWDGDQRAEHRLIG
jgi:2'-5' RNA ligase superfamily